MKNLKNMKKHGEWLVDHIYDLPRSVRENIFYDIGTWYAKEEEDTELEKGDFEYECRD
jgi:hypothetical protein